MEEMSERLNCALLYSDWWKESLFFQIEWGVWRRVEDSCVQVTREISRGEETNLLKVNQSEILTCLIHYSNLFLIVT